MKLERLSIRAAQSYDSCIGYKGEVTFASPLGQVTIHMNDTLSQRVLKECADEIVAASQEVGECLTANIIEQVEVKEEELIEPPPLDEVEEDEIPF